MAARFRRLSAVFAQRAKKGEVSGDFLPKHLCRGDCAGQSLFVSFDCDSLSEECVKKVWL